jgi:hypothetical protein
MPTTLWLYYYVVADHISQLFQAMGAESNQLVNHPGESISQQHFSLPECVSSTSPLAQSPVISLTIPGYDIINSICNCLTNRSII